MAKLIQLYFHEIGKIASRGFYNIIEVVEIHDHIFTVEICKNLFCDEKSEYNNSKTSTHYSSISTSNPSCGQTGLFL